MIASRCHRVSECCAPFEQSCREPRPRRHRHDRQLPKNATGSEPRVRESGAAGEIQTGTDDAWNAAAAKVRLIVWCKACGHQVEPDPAEHARRYGAAMPVPDWQKRLVCSDCGSHDVDMVVTGTER
jgi:hypothetical protein